MIRSLTCDFPQKLRRGKDTQWVELEEAVRLPKRYIRGIFLMLIEMANGYNDLTGKLWTPSLNITRP